MKTSERYSGNWTFERENSVIQSVLNSAFVVHTELGPGLMESVYEGALEFELRDKGLQVARQVPVPVIYKGQDLGTGFKADLIVESKLLLELKVVDELCDVHISQAITYLKLLSLRRGYLLNFNKRSFKDGIKRVSL